MTSPRASVIIVNWNGGPLVMEAVQSVLSQTIASQLKVIVVDNGSTDGSPDALEREFGDRIMIVRLTANFGFAGGNNRGFTCAEGKFVLLLNNDAVAEPGWAESLIEAAESDESIGMCTSKILCYDDRTIIDNTGHLMFRDGLNRSRGHLMRDTGKYDQIEEVLLASGCAALYRLDAVRYWGGFDEDFFAYGDDADLGFKLRLSGYRCLYVPESVVYHHQSFSTSRHSLKKIYWIERNRIWILVKYFPLGYVLTSPWYTARRLFKSWLAGRRNEGLAGYLVRNHPESLIIGVLGRAWVDAVKLLPRMIGKRRRIKQRTTVSTKQLVELLEQYSVPAREMSFG